MAVISIHFIQFGCPSPHRKLYLEENETEKIKIEKSRDKTQNEPWNSAIDYISKQIKISILIDWMFVDTL